MKQGLLSVTEAAQRLNVARKTVNNYYQGGKLPYTVINGRAYFKPEDVDNMQVGLSRPRFVALPKTDNPSSDYDRGLLLGGLVASLNPQIDDRELAHIATVCKQAACRDDAQQFMFAFARGYERGKHPSEDDNQTKENQC